ncbi:MAG: hypothetical protein HZA49_01250 [Planctomycetes bacterium]|nr:hypothetical protein [Planctomycetota bacterium]
MKPITQIAILILISAFVAALLMCANIMHNRPVSQTDNSRMTQQRWVNNISTNQVLSPQIPLNLANLGNIEISPPYIHKNMTLFVISKPPDNKPTANYITLDEGITQGKVKISEKENAEVERLELENNSDLPLFLQSGDIVKGGQQDRTIQVSITIPPHSGKIDIPSLCVEQSRWTEWDGGAKFESTCQNAPSKGMRMAAQKGDQSYQWASVSALKSQVSENLVLARSATSSVNEELENPKVKETIAEYEKALAPLLKNHPNAIGMAFALNGEINTIEIFQTPKLFQKVSSKLLKSWSLESIANPSKKETSAKGGSASGGKAVGIDEIKMFIAEMEKGKGTENTYNDNKVIRLENEKGLASDLMDKSKEVIHRQYIKK